MLRKLFMMFVVVPLGVIFVIFAVANRHAVTISLDPFGSDAPGLTATMPMFILIITLMGIGVIVGSTATWFTQGRWRRAVRAKESEARALRAERDSLQVELRQRQQQQAALPPPAP